MTAVAAPPQPGGAQHGVPAAHGAPAGVPAGLDELERLLGVTSAYIDGTGQERQASLPSRLAVLRSLGLDAPTPESVGAALDGLREAVARRACEPVLVAWDGEPASIAVAVPVGTAVLHCTIRQEDGAEHAWTVDPGRHGRLHRSGAVQTRTVELPELPWGYHRFHAQADGVDATCLVVRAPRTCHQLPEGTKAWIPFAPVYALRVEAPCGTLGDLRAVGRWAQGLGAPAVATLPLNAVFLDQPYDPSPYAPVSRRHWNELYLDLDAVPEAQEAAARARMDDPAWKAEAQRLSAGDEVDPRAAYALRRPILEAMAAGLRHEGPRRDALAAWLARHPEAATYAAFRAATERHGSWRTWPPALHESVAAAGPEPGRNVPALAWDADAAHYHLCAQFWMDEQLAAIKADAAGGAAGLALDLPVGVHGDGYDAWRDRDACATAASVGAPPDLMFRRGQDWGFPPAHPWFARASGYAALRASLQAQMRHASLLRVDHAMGIHRLYWVPHGRPADDGVYVRYPHEEMYAILCLESRRSGCVLFGEDLGTVPPDVPEAMRAHGLLRMHVLTMEAETGAVELRTPGADQVAYLDTHDTPPFAAYWSGEDIDRRLEDGQLQPAAAPAERERRAAVRALWRRTWRAGQADQAAAAAAEAAAEGTAEGTATVAARPAASTAMPPAHAIGPDAPAMLAGALLHLAASPSPLVVVNLEDLWLDPRPQNQPGTGPERPNWRRRMQVAPAALVSHPASRLLEQVHRYRQAAAAAAAATTAAAGTAGAAAPEAGPRSRPSPSPRNDLSSGGGARLPGAP